MTHEVIFAGFGGQGVMSLGEILTRAGMDEGKEVSWMPSYGPEMRGGAASCGVIVSEEPVGSPVVTEATAVVAMNLPSLDKFEGNVVPGGCLFINSSLIERDSTRSDVKVYRIPANDEAIALGNSRVAGMIMLGALLEVTKAASLESIGANFTKVFGEKRAKLWEINEKAILRGMEIAREKNA